MDSPLLSPTTETCGTSETCRTELPLPPPLDPNETNLIVPVNDNEQQYWKSPSIYRVPAFITKLHPDAYRPQVVSFGPYHHGEDHLLHMEEHKRGVLCHFLKRSRKTREPFLESLREVAPDLEESYYALDPKWKNGTGDQFLALMITDGCFMLEIMRTTVGNEKNDYAPNDLIFGTHRLAYIVPYISRDMLMLENQLPMLVLEHLVAVETNGKEGKGYIHKLILDFYSLNTCVSGMDRFLHVLDFFRKGLLMPEKVQCESEADGDGIIQSATELNEAGIRSNTCVRGMDRFLHVFRKGLLTLENMVQCGPKDSGDKIIWPATELKVAGIRFKKSETDSLNDISFSKGVLRLPAITVDDDTETMFLNIMTFERLHIRDRTEVSEVTCYVAFMDSIINNEQDVALLHDKRIIQNAYGTDKEVAKLFNSLCKEVTLASNSRIDAVQNDIRAYCNKRWNEWRAILRRTSLSNPWTILSLIAAIVLFALTTIQTVYIVLSYY